MTTQDWNWRDEFEPLTSTGGEIMALMKDQNTDFPFTGIVRIKSGDLWPGSWTRTLASRPYELIHKGHLVRKKAEPRRVPLTRNDFLGWYLESPTNEGWLTKGDLYWPCILDDDTLSVTTDNDDQQPLSYNDLMDWRRTRDGVTFEPCYRLESP